MPSRIRTMIVAAMLAAGQAGPAPAQEGRKLDAIPRAISGDTLEIKGKVMRLRDIDCPPFDTPEGREAKYFLTTMLRAPIVECFADEVNGELVGDCLFRASKLVRPRSMAAEMTARNLCQPFGRT